MELLPPQEGFFFGSYDIDKYYIEHLEYTVKTLKELLEETKGIHTDFEYYASW
jgi:hypothetical protein